MQKQVTSAYLLKKRTRKRISFLQYLPQHSLYFVTLNSYYQKIFIENYKIFRENYYYVLCFFYLLIIINNYYFKILFKNPRFFLKHDTEIFNTNFTIAIINHTNSQVWFRPTFPFLVTTFVNKIKKRNDYEEKIIGKKPIYMYIYICISK